MTYMLIELTPKATYNCYISNNEQYLKLNMSNYDCIMYVIKLRVPYEGWIKINQLKDYI